MAAHSFVLTERDLAMLQSLAVVRFLTVAHLQWLHWTERWREHERAALAAGVLNRRPKRAYERVRGLIERGLVVARVRSADRATSVYRRLANALSLSRAGAEVLACHHGFSLDGLWYDERARKPAATLEHSLAIGAFYAALCAEVAFRGRSLAGWRADHLLCTDYDSVTVGGVGHPLPIIPDATFALDGHRYFVEIDRGTTRIEQWRKKALAYRAYQGDLRLGERYGVSRATVLVVAPPGARSEAIARTIATIYNGVAADYLFLSEERVHPFSIRRRWQRMVSVSFALPRRGRKETPQPVMSYRDEALWAPTSEEGTA